MSITKFIESSERGHVNHGWLDSYHSFSFADYYNPQRMHYRSLRVINQDRINAKQGFPTHPHKDAEIFSYMLEGDLQHRDTLGNGSVVQAGGIQYMSTGSGVQHSEFNPGATANHFLQIWLLPDKNNAKPRYETASLSAADKANKLALFLSPDGRGKSMRIQQDALIYASTMQSGDQQTVTLNDDRYGYLHLALGSVTVNGLELAAGDAIEFRGELRLSDANDAEFIVFDLA